MRALLSQPKNIPGIILTVFSVVLCTNAMFAAQGFRQISQWFPSGISFVGLVLSLVVMLWEFGIVTVGSAESIEGDATEGDAHSSVSAVRGFLTYMAWLTVLAATMMLFGGLLSILVWLVLFFRFRSRESWLRSVLYSLAAIFAIAALAVVLHVFLPVGSILSSGDWMPKINIRF